jgi:hypothetical protein
MSRLLAEFERLYLGEVPAGPDIGGVVRALVFGLKRPLSWSALGRVFHGVQADFGWPAPAIAVSGEGLQLWFSLQEPTASGRALALLASLERRWLADVEPRQVELHGHPVDAVPRVPAPLGGAERWSAFVAADLVTMFEDTPWLDVEPSEEGQAALLRSLQRISPRDFEAAERRVGDDEAARAAASAMTDAPSLPPRGMSPGEAPLATDPRQFLLSVMNDASVPLALRIQAAKALIP